MKKWQKILTFSALFLVCAGAFAGLWIHFAKDRNTQAANDTSDWVPLSKIKNSGEVISYMNPDRFYKDEDEELGSEQNPFLVLEVTANEASQAIGMMIAGCEPFDVDEACEKGEFNTGLSGDYGVAGAAGWDDSSGMKKFFLTIDPPTGSNWHKTNVTEMKTGYLSRITQADIDADEDGELVRYDVKGLRTYHTVFSGDVYNTSEPLYFAHFKYVGAGYNDGKSDSEKVTLYSPVDGSEANVYSKYGYTKDAAGNYVFEENSSQANRTCVDFVKDDENGQYIMDFVSQLYENPRDYAQNDFDYGKKFLYVIAKDVIDTAQMKDGDVYTIVKSDTGMFTWNLVPTDDDGNPTMGIEDVAEADKNISSLLSGAIDKCYMEQEYTQYTGYGAQYYYSYHKFLISGLGLGADCGYEGYGGYDGANTKYPKKLAKAIKNYHIRVKSITPEQLGEHVGWIDKADLIVFNQNKSYCPGVNEMNKYARVKRLRGTVTDVKTGEFIGNQDLTWETVEHIMERCIVQRACGIITDVSRLTTSMNDSGLTKEDVVTYQYSIGTSKMTQYPHNSGETGSLNNYYKLHNMLLCMEQQTFVNTYWKTGMIVKDTVNGKETGRFVAQPTEDAQLYWTDTVFLPCYYNSKAKKNVAGNQGLLEPYTGSGNKGTNKDWLSKKINGSNGPGAIYDLYGARANWRGSGEGNWVLWGQVMAHDNEQVYWFWTQATGLFACERVDDDAVYKALGWTKDPETGIWTGPNGETEITDEMRNGLKVVDGFSYVMLKGFTPPDVGKTFDVLDIEASNWYEVDDSSYDERKISEKLVDNRIKRIEEFLSLERGMTVNVTFVTPDTLNSMTCNYADEYDMIVLGDSAEHMQIVEDNKVVGTYNAKNLADYTSGSYLYSHAGKSGYSGNDITKKTYRKLKKYINAGNAFLIWELNSEDTLLKTDSFKVKDDDPAKKTDLYEITDKIDPKSNMYKLLELLAKEAKAYDNLAWISYTENVIDDVQDRDEDVTATAYMANALRSRLDKIQNNGISKTFTNKDSSSSVSTLNVSFEALGHYPGVMTTRNLVYLMNKYDSFERIASVSTLNRVIMNYYRDLVQVWYEAVSNKRPEIVLSTGECPVAYKGAVSSDTVDSRNYITIASNDDLSNELNFGFTIQGTKGVGTYDTQLYIDFDANGAYTDSECVATINGVQATTSGAIDFEACKKKFTYDSFDRNVKSFFESRVGGFTWKIVATKSDDSSVVTEKIVTSAIKRTEKETLRILQIVPDDTSKVNLDIQEEAENGWIKTYTENLVDYYFAPVTMTVSEFESLYDTKITNNYWETRVQTATGISKMRVKDKIRLSYDAANIKTDRLAQFDVVILGFSEGEMSSINNTYGALDNLLAYIYAGNSVIFGSGVMTDNTSTETIKIPADISDRVTESGVSSEAAVHTGGGAGGDAGDLDGGSITGKIEHSGSVTTQSAVSKIARKYPDGYVYTKLLRAVSGQDRYGNSRTDADSNITVESGYIRSVLRTDTKDNGETSTSVDDGYSYKYLLDNGASLPFADSYIKKKTHSATMVNTEGQIANYPYRILNDYVVDRSAETDEDIDTSKMSNTGLTATQIQQYVDKNAMVQLDSFSIAEAEAQPYTLYLEDMSRDNAGDLYSDDTASTDDVTVWATLEGDLDENTMYESSPKNGANNYYLYARGNIFYLGIGGGKVKKQSYVKTISTESDETEYTIASDMEKMLFINTVIAAYSKAKDLLIEVPPAYEVNANDFYYYLKTDDIDNIMHYGDGSDEEDYEYIIFRVSDSKSTTIPVTVKYEDGTTATYPYLTDADGNILYYGDGSIKYDTSGTKIPLEIYRYDGDDELVFDKNKLGDLMTLEANATYAAEWPEYDEHDNQLDAEHNKSYKLHNNQLYVIKYLKKSVNNAEKDKLIIRAAKDGNKSRATISVMSKGYFQLD